MVNEMKLNSLVGLPSGFEELDAVISEWQRGNFVVIGGRPAMGKTAFALSLAHNMAVERRMPLAMFSLEMSTDRLMNRLKKMYNQEGESPDIYDVPFYVDDTPSISVSGLQTKARRLVSEQQVRLIMIDYVQLMTADDKLCNSRREEMTIISHGLKSLAMELDIPILAFSQLNLPTQDPHAYTMETVRPQLCDLRESTALAEDADIVCLLHRPEYYHIYHDQYGNDMKGVTDLIIAKNHHGNLCDVPLHFDSERAVFVRQEKLGHVSIEEGKILGHQVIDAVLKSNGL